MPTTTRTKSVEVARENYSHNCISTFNPSNYIVCVLLTLDVDVASVSRLSPPKKRPRCDSLYTDMNN